MKIRIVLADTDENYIEHFVRFMKVFYLNVVEVVAFSKKESLEKYLQGNVYDILLYSENFPELVTSKKICACMVDTVGIKEVNGVKAICKYQRVDRLYKEIIYVLAEEKKGVTYASHSEIKTCFVGFTSAAGGVGKTVTALTYARKMVQKGYQVLYLSLEEFSTQDIYLNALGEMTISNVLFAIKCKKGNIQLKIESALRKMYGSLYFLAQSQNPTEIAEMSKEDWKELYTAIKNMGKFHCVVLDMPTILSGVSAALCTMLDRIVVVTDGKDVVTAKTQRMLDWVSQMDQGNKTNIRGKMISVQNRSNGPKRQFGIPIVSQLPFVLKEKTEIKILEELVRNEASDQLYQIYVPGGADDV